MPEAGNFASVGLTSAGSLAAGIICSATRHAVRLSDGASVFFVH